MSHKSAMYRTGAAIGLLILILDGQTALAGMRLGIEVCTNTLVPSLFPFMVLSGIITGNVREKSGTLMKKLGQFCRIPEGAESVLLTGFLGGYPVGARNTVMLFNQGLITREDTRRMCVFCNNAGPSFLFGILMPLFSDASLILLLWIIQMLSSILLGHFLPGGSNRAMINQERDTTTVTEAVTGSIRVMGTVCAWVVLFRMVLEFLNNWVLFRLPPVLQVLFTGILELSNGCLALSSIEQEPLRFLIAGVILSFGGICICLQTASICPKDVRKGYYVGKIIHSLLSGAMALVALALMRHFPTHFILVLYLFAGFILVFFPSKIKNSKKEVAF